MECAKPTDNPDISRERQGAAFKVETLTHLYDGGHELTSRRRQAERKVLADREVETTKRVRYMDQPQQYEDGMKDSAYLIKNSLRAGHYEQLSIDSLWMPCPFEASPILLHFGMFTDIISTNSTEEQRKKWLPKCHSFEIIGTYAQTEMGHGTHVRGLETTATYDPASDEFILHSPTITSIKFWPGGLGKTANYSVVMAQLYTQSRCYGVHPFLVQLRSLDNHEPMPGITVGDIGPKLGFHTNDNGFLRMEHVRIPRENMLARYNEVLRNGTYVKIDQDIKKPLYMTMMAVRAHMITDQATGLAATVTIGIRYSVVRRQNRPRSGDHEVQILDFQTQQYKLFPILATTYAINFTAQELKSRHKGTRADSEAGNYDDVPEVHALSAGLKAFATYATMSGMEVCRLACGGHGYLQASGMPKIYSFTAAAATYEGENTVMYLQTARYLVKIYQRAQAGESIPAVFNHLVMKSPTRCTLTSAFTLDSLVEVFQYRARRLLERAVTRLQKRGKEGKSMPEAWNMCTVDFVKAAEAQCHLYVLRAFAKKVSTVDDTYVATAMSNLCQLYGLHGMTKNMADYLEESYISKSQVDFIEHKVLSLLAEIRPNAVALVDAFDFSDHQLGSVLGRFDGHVYDNLYKWAAESPLNESQVHDSSRKYLQPMIQHRGAVSKV